MSWRPQVSAIDTLFFDAADTANRYSAVDTIREQGSAYLGLGSRLLALDGDPNAVVRGPLCAGFLADLRLLGTKPSVLVLPEVPA